MLANFRTQGDHDLATGRQILIAAAVLTQIVARQNWVKVKERDRYTYVLTETGFMAGRALT